MFVLVKLKKSSSKGDSWELFGDSTYPTKAEGDSDIKNHRASFPRADKGVMFRCIPAENVEKVCGGLVRHWGYPY